MVVSALIGAGPTVGRVGEFGAFSRLFGGNLVSVSIDLEFVVMSDFRLSLVTIDR